MKDSEPRIRSGVRVRPEVSAAVSGDRDPWYPDVCLHDLFAARAKEIPTAPAILFEPSPATSGVVAAGWHRLHYDDLNRRANQLARHLRALGVRRETLVGIGLDRSADMTIALLGILKAGGTYLPLDPSYPAARLAFMLEDSRAPLVVTQERFAGLFVDAAQVVCLDRDRAALDALGADDLSSITTPEDAAYVIYTSGTTGQPKGVVGLHRGAMNRLGWMWRAYPFGTDEVCCQKTSLNFVDSVSEIFSPLLHGIPTVILPDDAVRDPRKLVEILATTGVTRLVLVPSLLRDILAVPDVGDRLAALKVCVSSGETLPVGVCRRFHELLPDAVLLNLYGSTEVSADVTCFDTRQLPPDAAAVPLGRPIDNTRISIVDDDLQPVRGGASGELCVSGAGLARGYLNRPDLTSERFISGVSADAPLMTMYRTGDRACYLPDGNIAFLGRIDQQVKIRGVRVEPGEVEAVLAAHPDVAQAVVIARQDGAGDMRLVAYVVSKDPAAGAVGDLRRFCSERLPDHMVPSIVVPMDGLPLTPSGKVDRGTLPAPERARPAVGGSVPPPRTSVEQGLVTIWRTMLEIDDVGVADDFFALGGDSLLAMRMIARVGEVYGRRLPVSVLAKASTIERLADVVVRPEAPDAWSPLIDLQPRGVRRPFFLVHGIGGEVLTFAGLAQRLAPDQPVYGIRAKGSDGVHEPLGDVESMAACYVEAVRTAEPEGPYLLGGYCSGGTVALEMARQLRASGQDVALLAMIDTEAPAVGGGFGWREPGFVGAYLRNLASWIVDDEFLRSPTADKIERLRSKGRLLRDRVRSFVRSGAAPDIRDVLGVWRFPERHRAFLETHSRALANYEPHEYDGPITLIRARTVSLATVPPYDLGWSRLARGPLDVCVVPGAHDNILTEPRVEQLAAQLRACLDSVHARQLHL